jgi:hypothetical protein
MLATFNDSSVFGMNGWWWVGGGAVWALSGVVSLRWVIA